MERGDSGWRGGIAGGRRGEGRRVSMSTGVRKGNVEYGILWLQTRTHGCYLEHW